MRKYLDIDITCMIYFDVLNVLKIFNITKQLGDIQFNSKN